jgi:hypothetical protein
VCILPAQMGECSQPQVQDFCSDTRLMRGRSRELLDLLAEAADLNTQVTLLSIGLSTLALAALQKED